MKSARFLFLVLVVLAVAFATIPLINCSDDSSTPYVPPPSFPAAKGKLTVFGLSNFYGKYVYVSGSVAGGKMLYGLTGMTGYPNDTALNLVKISYGDTIVPMYSLNTTTSSSDYFIPYDGDDKIVTLHIVILSDSTLKLAGAADALLNNIDKYSLPINTGTFSSGNLFVNWKSGIVEVDPNIQAMITWWDSQPANTPETPYTYQLNVSNLGGDSSEYVSVGYVIRANSYHKYVNLDLSGSTFTSIGDRAFLGCYSLANVIIPASVTSIGDRAFAGCDSLASITIPASVTSIGNDAFASCYSLTSVTFATGSNITSFGYNAFPEGSSGIGGDNLKTAYETGKAGTYTRAANGSTWTKQ